MEEKIKVRNYCLGYYNLVMFNGITVTTGNIETFDLKLAHKLKTKNVYTIPDKRGKSMKTPDTKLVVRIEHDLENDTIKWFERYEIKK